MRSDTLGKWIRILLPVLFVLELAGLFLPAALHEALGVAFIALAVAHNDRNRWFYESLKERRDGAASLNALALGAFSLIILALFVSGVGLSRHLFAWVPLPDLANWRSVHMIAAVASLFALCVHALYNMKRSASGWKLRAAAGIGFLIAAAGVFGLPYMDRWVRTVEVDKAVVQGEKAAVPGRVITVYFGRVGNTEFPADADAVSGASLMKAGGDLAGNAQMIALMVQDAAGGDIGAVLTEKAYPASYPETTREGRRELDEGASVALKPGLPDLAAYDTVFAVYPVWWGTLPKAMETYLAGFDLKGKTVVPIATHGGSGAAESVEAIRQAVPGARVLGDGFPVYSSDIPYMRKAIGEFVREIGEKAGKDRIPE